MHKVIYFAASGGEFNPKKILKGIVKSNKEFTKNDLLNILAFTKRNKIKRAFRQMKNAPILMSMFFYYDYFYEGETISITYSSLKEIDFRIGNVYRDRF